MNKNTLIIYFLATGTVLINSKTFANSLDTDFDKGYLVFSSEDQRYQMKLDGRIMLDMGSVSSDKNHVVSNNQVRRARLGIKTRYDNKWAGEFDIDISGNEAEMKDMWVSYIGFENTSIKIGNHKPFYSMAEMTTSRWYTFLETSMATDVTGPGRRMGISASHHQDNFFIGGSLFGDPVAVDNAEILVDDPDDTDDSDGTDQIVKGKNEPFSYSMRAVYRPWLQKSSNNFFHAGFSYMNLQPQSDDESNVKLNVRPESKIFDYKFLDTGEIKDIDHQQTQNIELAGRYNKFMFQTEFVETELVRDSSSDESNASFSGFYVDLAYALLGNGRPYNLTDAEFGPVIPSNQHGDLELAVRYSSLDLNDSKAGIEGGKSDNITLALNWYAHTNVVFRLNHTIAKMDENANADEDEELRFEGDDTVNITSLRVEYLF